MVVLFGGSWGALKGSCQGGNGDRSRDGLDAEGDEAVEDDGGCAEAGVDSGGGEDSEHDRLNATDAAGDLIGDLTLTYNKLRQNKITTELSEITAGKIALE